MIGLVKRAWIPIVMVVVLVVGAFMVSRLHGVFGSHRYVPDAGNADAIVQFNPKWVLYEVFGPAGTVADVNYLDADAQPQRVDGATLPWSLTLVTTLRPCCLIRGVPSSITSTCSATFLSNDSASAVERRSIATCSFICISDWLYFYKKHRRLTSPLFKVCVSCPELFRTLAALVP